MRQHTALGMVTTIELRRCNNKSRMRSVNASRSVWPGPKTWKTSSLCQPRLLVSSTPRNVKPSNRLPGGCSKGQPWQWWQVHNFSGRQGLYITACAYKFEKIGYKFGTDPPLLGSLESCEFMPSVSIMLTTGHFLLISDEQSRITKKKQTNKQSNVHLFGVPLHNLIRMSPEWFPLCSVCLRFMMLHPEYA